MPRNKLPPMPSEMQNELLVRRNFRLNRPEKACVLVCLKVLHFCQFDEYSLEAIKILHLDGSCNLDVRFLGLDKVAAPLGIEAATYGRERLCKIQNECFGRP